MSNFTTTEAPPPDPNETITTEDDKFLTAFYFCLPCCLVFLMIFLVSRDRYKKIYQPNDFKGKVNGMLALIMFVWNNDDILEICGTDAYFYVETVKTCFYIMVASVPGLIIVAPVYSTGDNIDSEINGNLATITLSNVDTGGNHLWAGFALMVWITCIALYLMRKNFRNLSMVADVAHCSDRMESYTVMVSNIDVDEKEFRGFIGEAFGDNLLKIEYSKNVSEVQVKWDEVKLARSLVKTIEEDGESDGYCCGCVGGTGLLEDAKKLQQEAEEKYHAFNIEDLKDNPVAFVTFDNMRSAVEFASSVLRPGGQSMIVRMAPFKEDIYWESLHLPIAAKQAGDTTGKAAYLALIIMYTPIIIWIQGIANIQRLGNSWSAFSWVLDLDASLIAFIEGYLPIIIVTIFFALLPICLWYLVGLAIPDCKNDQEGIVLPRYADCLIGMGLLVTFFSGGIMSDVGTLGNPQELYETLGREVPLQSSYFILYVLNSALFGLALELSGVVAIIWSVIMGGEQPEMLYYTQYPHLIMVFSITLTYSIISPFIILWGLVYFGMAYWIFKYQLLYVYIHKKNSYTWKFYPTIYHRLHVGLFIGQLVVIGVFSLKGGAIVGPLSIFALLATLYIFNSTINEFSLYFQRPSLETAVRCDDTNGNKTFENEDFVAPCLKELLEKNAGESAKKVEKIEVEIEKIEVEEEEHEISVEKEDAEDKKARGEEKIEIVEDASVKPEEVENEDFQKSSEAETQPLINSSAAANDGEITMEPIQLNQVHADSIDDHVSE